MPEKWFVPVIKLHHVVLKPLELACGRNEETFGEAGWRRLRVLSAMPVGDSGGARKIRMPRGVHSEGCAPVSGGKSNSAVHVISRREGVSLLSIY